MIEFKVIPYKLSQVKTDEDNPNVGYIAGYASTFGNIDQGDDIIDKGAFKRTIKDRKGKWPFLLNHWKHVGYNIEAEEDDFGLKTYSEMLLDDTEALYKYKLAKRAFELGTQMGLSIGYRAIKFAYEDIIVGKITKQIRRIKEIKMFEHSLVTFPMNELAYVTGIKSANFKHRIDQLIEKGYSEEDLIKALANLEASKSQAAIKTVNPEFNQLIEDMDVKNWFK